MSLFKRLSASVYARVDRLVGAIENHDAVIETALRESREAVARAKVRLNRVRQDGERIARDLDNARTDERRWTERARQSADEETALECVRRRRAAQQRIASLEEVLQRHREGEARLNRETRAAEERVARLSEQHRQMRTRESAAEALGRLDAAAAAPLDVEAAFDRWEERLTAAELSLEPAAGADPLQCRFEAAEERDALRAELDALKAVEVGDER